MVSVVQKLNKEGVLQPPKWLPANVCYEALMGSVAYGVSSDTSDMDVYGFCIPPKDDVFPHLRGEIDGFGRQKHRFAQYQQHHIKSSNGKDYDVSIYSIVKYFHLCMENNPNMIDSLFVPHNCVLSSTAVGEMVRADRKLFLHKGAFHKFKGYAFAQMHKIRSKNPTANDKRRESVEQHGYDTKYAYHLVRLLLECEQILIEHDLDIQRNRELLKSIRRGEWTLDYLEEWFASKETALETLYAESKLQHSPDEEAIRGLLINCLEHHYGSLSNAVQRTTSADMLGRDVLAVLERHLGVLR